MEQFLPRGYRVSADNRIKKLVTGGNDWQILLTNADSYVLAVKPDLYRNWVADCLVPTGIFTDDLDPQYWIFQSMGHYIISSIANGPYPEDNGQVEAFSIAFKTASEILKRYDISDAIYIEEYLLILPVLFSEGTNDYDTVYGRWITGGINISINSFDRVREIMSWLPQNSLLKSARLAGFELPDVVDVKEDGKDSKNDSHLQSDTETGVEQLKPEEERLTADRFTLTGRRDLEQFFNDNIVDIVLHQDRYRKMGISFPGATILYGPPGCGKTYAVEKLSEFLGWKRFDIDSSTIASSYIHDTSKKISAVFQSAINAAPSILVIDEMEAFLADRRTAGASGTYHIEEVAEFLRRIPEAISKGVLVFAMTNMINSIDPAIVRRGRFDHVVEVKMPDSEEIEALLQHKFMEIPIAESVDAGKIAKKLDGHPMSDITFVLREAGRYAVKRNLELISEDCFADAIRLIPKKDERPKIGFVNE